MSNRLSLSFLVLFLASPSYAGPSSSGGGPAIICPDSTGKVGTAQLLDFFEGTIPPYNLTITKSDMPVNDQLIAVEARLKKYNYFIASDFASEVSYVQSHINFLPAGLVMPPGIDLGTNEPVVIPDGCQLEYAGYYSGLDSYGNGTLNISQDVWDKLDNTDRAALFAHEALYKLAREFSQATDSEDSREFNAYLFSTADLSNVNSIAPEFTWPTSQVLTVWVQGVSGDQPQPASFSPPVILSGDAASFLIDISNPPQSPLEYYAFCQARSGQIMAYWTGPAVSSDPLVTGTLASANCELVTVVIERDALNTMDPFKSTIGVTAGVTYAGQKVGGANCTDTFDVAPYVTRFSYPVYH